MEKHLSALTTMLFTICLAVLLGAAPALCKNNCPVKNQVHILEAEDFDANQPTNTHQWQEVSSPPNYSGRGAMEASPENGVRIIDDYESNSPHLEYNITFKQKGLYYIWMRGYCNGKNNLLHAGLNGQGVISAKNITLPEGCSWTWTSVSSGGKRVCLPIEKAGLHTIDVWMADDGLIVDKILLVNNASFVPKGIGPVEDGASLYPPDLISPEANAMLDNGCPEDPGFADPLLWDFSWSSVPAADRYELSIMLNGVETINRVVNTAEYSYVCYRESDEIPLCQIDANAGDWTWRVRAGDGTRWSDWSNARSFKVESAESECTDANPFGPYNARLNPASPAELEAGTPIDITFNFAAPYLEGAYITIIPFYQSSPLPESSYAGTKDQLFTDGYPSAEGKAHLTVNQEGLFVDQIMLQMDYQDHSFCGSIEIPVDYSFTPAQTGACQPPVLDPIGDLWVEFGDDNSFVITAADPDTADGDLTFTSVVEPGSDPEVNNNCYFDGDTRTYTCEMRDGDNWGSHQQRFTVCDDCTPQPLCDEEVVTVTEFIGKNYLTSHSYYNVDGMTTNGPTDIEFEFADDSHDSFAIHVKSTCNATLCDYGVAEWDTGYADYNGPNPIVASFEFDWGTATLTIDPIKASADTIQVSELREYNDGRPDASAVYNFLN